MTNERKRLGAWGESVAATHLEAHGYVIVRRNWRCALGELDIVAQHGDELAFVEVKTRRGYNNGTPEEGVTKRKAQKLIQLALTYLSEFDIDEEVDFTIDVVAIQLDGSGKLVRCEHIKNAVTAW